MVQADKHPVAVPARDVVAGVEHDAVAAGNAVDFLLVGVPVCLCQRAVYRLLVPRQCSGALTPTIRCLTPSRVSTKPA